MAEMKAQLPLPTVAVEVFGQNQRELFEQAASAAEVFGETECGVCKSRNIRPNVRHVTGNGNKPFTYYEWQCLDCKAKVALGQSSSGDTLFPKRKLLANGKPDLAKGTFGPHNGWSHYRGEDRED